jgi:hypothetical protein
MRDGGSNSLRLILRSAAKRRVSKDGAAHLVALIERSESGVALNQIGLMVRSASQKRVSNHVAAHPSRRALRSALLRMRRV